MFIAKHWASVIFLWSVSAAWAGHQPDHVGERLTPDQVGAEKRLGGMLTEARVLAQRGSYEAAARNYLHVFNYGRGVARLEAVRLAFVPVEIVALAEKFPPALQALREEVRIRAGLILTAAGGTDEMLEFVTLNRVLDQPKRSLELYDQLKGMGESARETRALMREVIGVELLEARRYDELGERLLHMASRTAQRIAMLESALEFGTPADSRTDYLHAQRASILSDTTRIYDGLLNTQREAVAHKLALRVLNQNRTPAAYTALLRIAIQAQNRDAAQRLLQNASTHLDKKELAELQKLLPPN